MPLVRVSKGLIEKENFFMTSLAEDFLGNGEWHRKDEYLELLQGTLARNLPYDEFMIDLRKDVAGLNKGDVFSFFIEDNFGKMGIWEEAVKTFEYCRLIYNDNFIQAYVSKDGVNWINIGGDHYIYGTNLRQGFYVKGSTILKLTDYKVYKSPFLTIQNFKPKTIVKLYTAEGELLKEREFKEDWTCEIFLDYSVFGYLEFYEDGKRILKSDKRELQHGDTYLFTTSSLQLVYKNEILEDELTLLSDELEMVTLRNPENKDVYDVKLKVINDNLDTILISLDNINYYTELAIEQVKANEDKYIYIKIIKNMHYRNFKVNDFEIVVY